MKAFRLRPVYSATDTDGSGDFLLKFVPAVLRIAVSASVLKIRSLAARALVSIVPQSEQPRLILTLSNAFEQQKVVSESAKHGILLIVSKRMVTAAWMYVCKN